MALTYRPANRGDAALLVEIYNAAFRDDYLRYGECPAYGRSREGMERSIERHPKVIVFCEDVPVGSVTLERRGGDCYYLGCLCVIPPYQRRGIGARALRHALATASDWRRVELVTPANRASNIRFYEKCGFVSIGREMDGNVEVVRMALEK